MAIDLVKNNKHGIVFPNKIAAASGSPHQFNITLAADHDNGELILRGGWHSFDNYDEDENGTVDFEGVIREPSAEGGWYVEVTKATDALLVYNTPVSPYPERELRDEGLFYNAEGDTVRVYSLIVGDIFSVQNIFDGTPEAGASVTFADGKYVVGSVSA